MDNSKKTLEEQPIVEAVTIIAKCLLAIQKFYTDETYRKQWIDALQKLDKQITEREKNESRK